MRQAAARPKDDFMTTKPIPTSAAIRQQFLNFFAGK